jgi:hypothetical protein
MEAFANLETAAIVIDLAALGGLTMAVMRFTGTPRPPDWMPPIHGLVAATGVILLAWAALTTGIPGRAQAALGLFVLAAIGGLTIYFRFHRQGLALPIPFVLGHGAAAATGYVLLLLAVFSTA